MKTIAATVAILASTVLATPLAENGKSHYLRRAQDMGEDVGPLSAMVWTGPVVAGGPDVTLHGTAEAIYHQILERNPAYDHTVLPGYQEKRAEIEARGGLQKREKDIDCNWGNLIGNWSQCWEGIEYLEKLGNAWCGTSGASCSRVSCSHNCGMFLCTDEPRDWRVSCMDIAADLNEVRLACESPVFGRTHGRMIQSTHFTGLSQESC